MSIIHRETQTIPAIRLQIHETLSKANASVKVNPFTQFIVYGNSINQYCTASTTCNIYRNDTSLSNNTNEILGAGTYFYTANISDSFNYTNWNDTSTLTISKATVSITSYNNGSTSDASYPRNSIINLTGTIDSLYNVNLSISLNFTGYGDSFPLDVVKK
jgi:hypothetical protein